MPGCVAAGRPQSPASRVPPIRPSRHKYTPPPFLRDGGARAQNFRPVARIPPLLEIPPPFATRARPARTRAKRLAPSGLPDHYLHGIAPSRSAGGPLAQCPNAAETVISIVLPTGQPSSQARQKKLSASPPSSCQHCAAHSHGKHESIVTSGHATQRAQRCSSPPPSPLRHEAAVWRRQH